MLVFTRNFCLLETSLIRAGAQTKVYFRHPKQTFRGVTITETDALLPRPYIFCGWIYACLWRAGDKFQAVLVVRKTSNYSSVGGSPQGLSRLEMLQPHSLTRQQRRATDSHVSRFAEMVRCPSETRTPFCGADTASVSHEKWCGRGDPGLLLSLGAQRALGMQRP